MALLDRDNGMGHLVVQRAAQIALEKARRCGVAWVRATIQPCETGVAVCAHGARAAHDRHVLCGQQCQPLAVVGWSLVVNHESPLRSAADLIGAARKAPGKINYRPGGTGSPQPIATTLFASHSGVQMIHVPYKGTGQALTDLRSGVIDLMFAPGQTVSPHVKGESLVALAVTSGQRAKSAPELPTITETSPPGYAAVGWFGLLAPALRKPCSAAAKNRYKYRPKDLINSYRMR